MAKSLRSKWKRKMRAIKRERYAVKELKQLKTVLDNAEKKDFDISEICTVLPKDSFKNLSNADRSNDKKSSEGEIPSAMEVESTPSKYHPKHLTNEHGNYPVWMNQRAIKKHKARTGRVHKNVKKNRNKKH